MKAKKKEVVQAKPRGRPPGVKNGEGKSKRSQRRYRRQKQLVLPLVHAEPQVVPVEKIVEVEIARGPVSLIFRGPLESVVREMVSIIKRDAP